MLNENERQQAIQLHLPYGIPIAPADATNEMILAQAEYVTNYEADLRVPTWVAYRLRRCDVETTRQRTVFPAGLEA